MALCSTTRMRITRRRRAFVPVADRSAHLVGPSNLHCRAVPGAGDATGVCPTVRPDRSASPGRREACDPADRPHQRPINGYGLVKRNMKNVPQSMPQAWLYPTPAPTNPFQYFYE